MSPSHHPDYVRAYRAKNRARINAAKRVWYRTEAGMAKHKAYAQATYLKNKEKIKARVRAWQIANKDRKNASKRRRYREARDYFLHKGRVYAAARRVTGKAAEYRDKIREKQRLWSAQRSEQITDGYAREQLSKYSPISAKQWPQVLVEAKRLQIKIKRTIKHT